MRPIEPSQSAPSVTAFRPVHGRAACALTPGTRTSTFTLPLQPISTFRSVGSSTTARRAFRSQRNRASTRFKPFFAAGPSSQS